jgi:N-acetyl-beta-hexosaminidase
MRNFLIGLSLAVMLAACDQGQKFTLNVVPYPNEITAGSGSFRLSGAEIRIDPDFDSLSTQAAQGFAERVSMVTGKKSSVTHQIEGKGVSFVRDTRLEKEEYRIDVSNHQVTVSASGTNGVVYAIQTLSQMLPSAFFGNIAVPTEDWSLPGVTIQDKPRFAHRGLMVDCARHFFSIDELKRVLDVMTLHKLNVFHWHLTDDQGWRIEIKKYPRLTEVGAFRNRKSFDLKDVEPYGGYYSQEQIRDIVSYAAARGITVIPEIDMPGHVLSALAAYPHLGCTGGPYQVWLDTGVARDVLCVGQESSYLSWKMC